MFLKLQVVVMSNVVAAEVVVVEIERGRPRGEGRRERKIERKSCLFPLSLEDEMACSGHKDGVHGGLRSSLKVAAVVVLLRC